MNIAVIAPTHLPSRRANTVQVMKMTQAFAAIGHSVRLWVPGLPPGGSTPPWEYLAQHYGIRHPFPVVWVPAYAFLRRYDFALRSVLQARSWGADLLYTRLPQAAAIASQRGVPSVLEVHDLPQGRIGPLAFRLFLGGKGARRMVVITQALAEDLCQMFGAPENPPFTMIAPDAVDLERFTDVPASYEARRRLMQKPGAPPLQPNRFTAGYTGHLYPGRGAQMLLELAERLPQFDFLLAGGEDRDVEKMQSQAQERGITNLYLIGFVPNAELPIYQASCDVLLMPYQERVAASSGGDISRYLSPMKVFEYMACGRPIISSDLPVLRETLREENAVLLPPKDVEAWVEALLHFHSNPLEAERLGAQAREAAARNTWNSRAGRVLEGLES